MQTSLSRVKYNAWCVMTEQIRAPDSSFGVSEKQSLGSSPSCDTCVLKQDT